MPNTAIAANRKNPRRHLYFEIILFKISFTTFSFTSTVKREGGGGGGSRKRSSGKPLKFTLLHVSIYLFQGRSKFFKRTWLCDFVPLCFFT